MADPTKHYVQYDITWASIALLYYDYALTFAMEVKYIWGRPKVLTSGTVLYVLCRYALVANVLYLLGMSDKLEISCNAWHTITAILGVLGRAAVIITFTRRAYAICAQNKWVLGVLGVLGIATVVTDAMNVPHQSCSTGSSSDLIPTIRSLLTIVFETLSTILITWRTIRTFIKRQNNRSGRFHGVEYFVFEQGVLYFCLISLLTFATFVLKLRGNSDFLQNLLDALTLPLSGMLTARFVLHLRAWDHSHSVVVDSNLRRHFHRPGHGAGAGDGGFNDLGTMTRVEEGESIGKLSFGPNPGLDSIVEGIETWEDQVRDPIDHTPGDDDVPMNVDQQVEERFSMRTFHHHHHHRYEDHNRQHQQRRSQVSSIQTRSDSLLSGTTLDGSASPDATGPDKMIG
ncbi:hypothetical protein K435DRAFT_838458 [Dendrothele bispora CBS 962.96]|uniref:DUF6533 domain-containing protein n=1 Tax=Dendrothele bispora (strain CBS 962.96) TaxID=1314807 RepID=A0A4S8M680_DENBC|nr:hypothetical protein K435DRAFT_838458 [Dendrothele bispora CBS 962.96]